MPKSIHWNRCPYSFQARFIWTIWWTDVLRYSQWFNICWWHSPPPHHPYNKIIWLASLKLEWKQWIHTQEIGFFFCALEQIILTHYPTYTGRLAQNSPRVQFKLAWCLCTPNTPALFLNEKYKGLLMTSDKVLKLKLNSPVSWYDTLFTNRYHIFNIPYFVKNYTYSANAWSPITITIFRREWQLVQLLW